MLFMHGHVLDAYRIWHWASDLWAWGREHAVAHLRISVLNPLCCCKLT